MDVKRDRFSTDCAYHEFGGEVGDLIHENESLRIKLQDYEDETWHR